MDNNDLVQGFNDEKDGSLEILLSKIEESPYSILVTLSGYIDTYNSAYFQKQMAKLMEKEFKNIVFNCQNLNYISSTGIGSLTSIEKSAKAKGGEIVFVGVQPKVLEVFQLLGFSNVFNLKDSIEEAEEYLKKERDDGESPFPKVFECPVCAKKLKAIKSGRFRCSECKAIIVIKQDGKIFLG
ncbi:anti-sigma factor antagonist [Treponema sp.]|uniref:anti-sigma factor antagonist n=1 Tax=Treponema sp. TaxID=166 RepID=UPI003F0C4D9D